MKIIASTALALLAAGVAGTALADLSVCNHSGVRTFVALASDTDAGYITRGWTTVEANGACTKVVTGALPNRFYYLYGHDEEGMEIAGNDRFCVVTGRSFNILNADQSCSGANREWRDFLEIDTGDEADFTFDVYDR